ncbi:MAG: S-ribosylhomocysteine lyase [Eubacterium sp.]|nr:S-ribosylhomocysteine lyase [Eubacterium sp.]
MSELKSSFSVDHEILKPGIYIKKIDGDITTYDIRMKAPNQGDYLTNSALHTIEHIFKAFLKNTEFADNIVYFGPMASRTGFYLLTKRLTDNYSIQLIKDAFAHISEFWGRIPEASHKDCGNCLEHNMPQAKEESKKYLEIIQNWTKDDLKYPVPETEE